MKSLVVANWKMNPASFREAKKLFEATREAAEAAGGVSVVVAPPAIYLRELHASYRGRALSFALQNAHSEAGGAHTGGISISQGKDAGASHIIVGHSERRAEGETSDDTRKKVAASLAAKLTPILCVGELKRTGSGEHFTFIKEQLRVGLADVSPAQISKLFIAYEPVWAIGGEQSVSTRMMHEMAIFIRKMIAEVLGEKGMGVKILYGGSVNESNASTMLREGDVMGLLVGHVSIEPARFSALLHSLT